MPSDTPVTAQARRDLSDAEVRAELDRILASPVFSRSQHLRRFLSFIVEQRLAGEGRSLKEAVLAHELYGKGTDFDGGTDPVVRVDARRLRDKLREYYEGRSSAVEISLPKGTYVPVFHANAEPPPDTIPAAPSESQAGAAERRGRTRMAIGALATAAVLIAMALLLRAFLSSPDDPPPRLVPLASYPGEEGAPALSPDGNLVAFAWSGHAGAGPADIYVKAVESEALQQLTHTPGSENSPAWSPDGRQIAFVRDGNGVFTISQLGGAERQVSATGTHPSWGGDSKSVFVRDRESSSGPFGIYRVFLDTLERRRLTQAPVGAGDWRFEVSPDGRWLAFIRYEKPGIADLYVVAVEGGEPRRLSNWGTTILGLSWTPDGREIVYDVDEPPASRLWRIGANSPTPARGSPIADIPAGAANPSISRPSPERPARLAFQTVTRDVDFELLDLDSRLASETIQTQPFWNSTRIEGSAQFSRDGSRVAIASFRSGASEVWVARRDGSAPRQVTTLGASGVWIGGWSPDGSHIAFEAASSGNTDIYVVGTEGGTVRRLTTEPSIDGVPAWSNDGRWIYFASTRAGMIADIWRVPADGGLAVRLTDNGGFEPRLSADGRYVFYLDRPPAALAGAGTARVMRLPAEGGVAEPVVDGVRPFLWSVTEAGIVFLTREADFDAIDTYRFSDQRVARLGRLGFRLPGIYPHLTVSSDGRWALATKMMRLDADLMRIDNFR